MSRYASVADGPPGRALQREYQRLVEELGKAADNGSGGRLTFGFLRRTNPADADFGVASFELGGVPIAANRECISAGTKALAAWCTQLMAELDQSQKLAATSPSGSLVPIYVNLGGSDATSAGSTVLVRDWNKPATASFPGATNIVPSFPQGAGLIDNPASSGAAWNGNASLGPLVNTAPSSWTAPVMKPWSYASSSAAPASEIRLSSSSASPTVSSIAPESSSKGQNTATSAIVASPIMATVLGTGNDPSGNSGTATPLSTSIGTIYVGQDRSYLVGTYDLGTGAAIKANFIASGLSAPEGMLVANNLLYVANVITSTIAVYNSSSGALVNPSLISGLVRPEMMMLSGTTLYVVDSGNNRVGTYNVSTGAAVKANFITGVAGQYGLAFSSDGKYIFVSNYNIGTVGEYDASTGAVINANFIQNLSLPTGLAVVGDKLFVAESGVFRVGEYSTTDGSTINAGFITADRPVVGGMAVVGNDLFITDERNDRISEYDVTTGVAVNKTLVTGLLGPQGVAVVLSIPEPSTAAMLLPALLALGAWRSRRRVV